MYKDPKIGTTNGYNYPGHSWATPGVYIGNLCDNYMGQTGRWDFSDLMLLETVAGDDITKTMMIDTFTKQFVPRDKVMSACLGSKAVKIQESVAVNFLDEEPNLFEGVELELL